MKDSQSILFGDPDVKPNNRISVKKILHDHQSYETKARDPDGIIKEAEALGRKKFYALTSGGKDSITMTNWLAEVGKLECVVHIQTNIGLKMTTDFVKDYCQEKGWPLKVIEPNPKFVYLTFCLEYGFPGPELHTMIMSRLKWRTMIAFAKGAGKDHCLVSGVRKFESNRRMKNYMMPIQKNSGMWFCAPFFYKTNEEIYKEYIANNLKISPAYKLGFNTSGECLCGSFAKRYDKDIIRKHDPHLTDYINTIEHLIQKFGTAHARQYGKWGGYAKMSDMQKQKTVADFFTRNPELAESEQTEGFICGQECGPGTLRGETDF